jgi:hypothetical protein
MPKPKQSSRKISATDDSFEDKTKSGFFDKLWKDKS